MSRPRCRRIRAVPQAFDDPRRQPAASPAAEDGELAARAVTGDRRAYERIYARHVDRVFGLCLRLTADRGEAELLTQDTFVKGWLALAGYAGRGGLGGWLGRIAVNLWRDRWRSRERERRLLEDLKRESGVPIPSPGAPAPRAAAVADPGRVVPLLTAVDLERVIGRLPDGARTVFVLHDVEGYTHEDIADLLGVVPGTVKSQLHRARRLLRGMLGEGKEGRHGA